MATAKRLYRPLLIFWALTCFLPVSQNAQPAAAIRPQEYRERRIRAVGLLEPSSVVAMKSVDPRVRSNDVNYRYRQESDFYYLTGLNEPGCYLLLTPRGTMVNGATKTIVLFVPPTSPMLSESWDSPEETVLSNDLFHQTFSALLAGTQTLYYSAPDLKFVYDWLNEKPSFIERDARKQLGEAHPGLRMRGLGGLLAPLRGIKSPAEILLIRKSIDVTGAGIVQAMKLCKPGRWEYELQAVIEYEMTRQGAEYQSFPSIIGSGTNSLILHYEDNRRQMQDGEMVVMDVGAEYEGYSADITRTIPVSGKFTPAQREVYSTVLRAQQAVIDIIKPGLPFRELDAKAREVIVAAGYGGFIQHGVSHGLGIDVHDVVGSDTLKAGMVITVEPGIYIPATDQTVKPEFRGFGVRIEDDVAVTPTGHEVLSKNIPKQPDEIERIMKK